MKTAKRMARSHSIDPRFQPVADAFAKHPDVTSGKLMASYGLKVHGKIFAMFGRSQFVAKLPKERVDELIGAGKGEHFNPGHGRLMKEWIALRSSDDEWVGVAREAYQFVKQSRGAEKDE
jgi:TfoX/Sxy family transcriptional regulator of competence genes